MKDRICLDYNYIFNDHMGKCSNEAKLYYIKLMFFANNGFVANPLAVLDSMGFDKGVFYELVNNDELLMLPGREEVFITAYFLHTHFNPASWLNSPFAIYWRGYMRTKSNGIATFKKIDKESEESKRIAAAEEQRQQEIHRIMKDANTSTENMRTWDEILDDLDPVEK